MSSEESVMGVLAQVSHSCYAGQPFDTMMVLTCCVEQIDNASKATTGTFVSYDGTAIKW